MSPVFYKGFSITTDKADNGWSARIGALAVETMLFPDRAAALAGAMAFVDGFLTASDRAPRRAAPASQPARALG